MNYFYKKKKDLLINKENLFLRLNKFKFYSFNRISLSFYVSNMYNHFFFFFKLFCFYLSKQLKLYLNIFNIFSTNLQYYNQNKFYLLSQSDLLIFFSFFLQLIFLFFNNLFFDLITKNVFFTYIRIIYSFFFKIINIKIKKNNFFFNILIFLRSFFLSNIFYSDLFFLFMNNKSLIQISGLPMQRKYRESVLRSPHIDKRSREQFEQRHFSFLISCPFFFLPIFYYFFFYFSFGIENKGIYVNCDQIFLSDYLK